MSLVIINGLQYVSDTDYNADDGGNKVISNKLNLIDYNKY